MSKKVKFDNKKFRNLDQLDRIEYFLHRKDLNDKHEGSITISMIWTFFYLISFILVIGLLMYIGFGNSEVLKVLGSIFLVMKYALIVSCILDIVSVIVYFRRSKRLNDEFLKRGGYI